MDVSQPFAQPTDAPLIARKLWQLFDPRSSGTVASDVLAAAVRQTSSVGRLAVSDESMRGFHAVLDHDGDGRVSAADVEQLVLRYFCGAGAVQTVSGTADPFRLHPGLAVVGGSDRVGVASQPRPTAQPGYESRTQYVTTGEYPHTQTATHTQTYSQTHTQAEQPRYSQTVLQTEHTHQQYLRPQAPPQPTGSTQTHGKVASLSQLQTHSVKTTAGQPPLSNTLQAGQSEPYHLFHSFEPAAWDKETPPAATWSQQTVSAHSHSPQTPEQPIHQTQPASSANSSTHTIYRPAAPSLRAQLAALDPHNSGFFPTTAVGPLIAQAYREAGIATEPSAADVQTYTEMLDYRHSGRVSTEDFEGLIVRALGGGQSTHH